jgi:predicted DsbA family dithiol-disulfide isomerase
MHTNMTQYQIKIVSDIICPWCYIGKQRLDIAIALYKEQHPGSSDTFSIEWVPYYINPDLPMKGIPRGVFLSQCSSTPDSSFVFLDHEINNKAYGSGVDMLTYTRH